MRCDTEVKAACGDIVSNTDPDDPFLIGDKVANGAQTVIVGGESPDHRRFSLFSNSREALRLRV